MLRRDVKGADFVELVKKHGVWFKEDLPDVDDVARSRWELNVIDVEDTGKSYLAYTWSGPVEHMFDEQTFIMIVGEYNDSMNGLPFWEDWCPVLSLIQVGERGQTPVYMGVWEDCLYEVPEDLA